MILSWTIIKRSWLTRWPRMVNFASISAVSSLPDMKYILGYCLSLTPSGLLQALQKMQLPDLTRYPDMDASLFPGFIDDLFEPAKWTYTFFLLRLSSCGPQVNLFFSAKVDSMYSTAHSWGRKNVAVMQEIYWRHQGHVRIKASSTMQ